MDQLLTAKMVESVSMATTSLVSLVQLFDKVKNMVISDHIQQEVSLTCENRLQIEEIQTTQLFFFRLNLHYCLFKRLARLSQHMKF